MSPPAKRRSQDSKETAVQESSKQRKTDEYSLGFNPDDPHSESDDDPYYESDDEFDGKQQEPKMVRMGQKGANQDEKDMKQDIILEEKGIKQDMFFIINGKRVIEKVDAHNEFLLDDGWDDDTEMDFEYYTTWLEESDFPQYIKERMMQWHGIALKSQGFELDDGAPEGYGWACAVKDKDKLELVNKLAPYAIEAYNRRFANEGKSILLEHVDYANIMRTAPNGVYFITLVARDKYGNHKRYQTRVSYQACEDDKIEIIQVPVFRPQVGKVS